MSIAQDMLWNEAIDRAVDVAAGFDAAINGKAMAPFVHDKKVCFAVIERDIAIARRIRQLKRPVVTHTSPGGGRMDVEDADA